MLVHITHQSYAESTDGLLRELHAAAKTTRSATVLAALERAAQTYYQLAYINTAEEQQQQYVAQAVLDSIQ